MIDKSWMLNPQAIRHAKTCIQIIRERTNQKLKLSQADFFQQLEDFGKNARSVEFIAAHHQLMSMAEDNQADHKQSGSRVALFGKKTNTVSIKAVDSVAWESGEGRHHSKQQAGKALQGLLRGQAQYQ